MSTRHREQHGGRWQLRAVLFTLAATATATLAGAALGALGAMLSLESRAGLATLLAFGAVPLALAQLAGASVGPIQCDRLTPKRWARQRALGWALRNGASLGLGAFTKLGFWLWYAVPLASFLAARPLTGAFIYGSYGVVRGAGIWAMIAAWQWRRFETQEWLIQEAPRARRLAALALAALAAFVFVAVGL